MSKMNSAIWTQVRRSLWNIGPQGEYGLSEESSDIEIQMRKKTEVGFVASEYHLPKGCDHPTLNLQAGCKMAPLMVFQRPQLILIEQDFYDAYPQALKFETTYPVSLSDDVETKRYLITHFRPNYLLGNQLVLFNWRK